MFMCGTYVRINGKHIELSRAWIWSLIIRIYTEANSIFYQINFDGVILLALETAVKSTSRIPFYDAIKSTQQAHHSLWQHTYDGNVTLNAHYTDWGPMTRKKFPFDDVIMATL